MEKSSSRSSRGTAASVAKPLNQPCLDWSERRYHLSGLLGARILDRLLALGWLKSAAGTRALQLTPPGRAGLAELFQVAIDKEGVSTLNPMEHTDYVT